MRRLVRVLFPVLALGVYLAAGGCVDVRVKELPDIHMTLDVNIRLQKEIKSDLDYLYSGDVGAPPKSPATQPGAGA